LGADLPAQSETRREQENFGTAKEARNRKILQSAGVPLDMHVVANCHFSERPGHIGSVCGEAISATKTCTKQVGNCKLVQFQHATV